MPTTNAKVTNKRVGDDWYFSLAIPGVTPADPIATVYFVLKDDEADADGAAAVFKTITTTLSGGSQITDTGGAGDGDGTAAATVKIPDTETDTLAARTPYYLAVKTVTAAGDEDTPIAGVLVALPKLVTSP